MEKYTFLKEIGAGSFGKVFLVKSKHQGINYVIKQVDLFKLDKKQSRAASKEVEVLAKLKHNNIVSYKESFEKNNQLNIVLEYCENGDLHDKIKEKRLSNKFFNENEILDYFVQICLALEYIHGQRILHRDLKTKNIFLTKGNVVKLGDFGIAKVLENTFELAQTCIGSPFYISPEICENKPYNKKSDVWALGCILYELSTLKYAFVAKNVKTLLAKILTGVYNPLPASLSIHIRSLISSMLKPNPKDRPSVREILEKRFLIKRRAVFICKAYKNGLSKRSKSGDMYRSVPVVNNERIKVQSKRGKFSRSCLQLNQLKENKKFNGLYNAEYKYLSKSDRKSEVKTEKLNIDSQSENPELATVEKHSEKNSNFENLKPIKLIKVDSKYYDLIAAFDKNVLENKNEFVGKQIPSFETFFTSVNEKPDSKLKMRKTETSSDAEKFIEPLLFSANDLSQEKIQKENKFETGNEHRKRWMKNTFQRETLLAMLNDSELLEGNLSLDVTDKPSKKPDSTVDDMLSFKPSEIKEEVLQPIKLDNESKKENLKNNYFQLLQHEVKHLREKFELNNKAYQMEDLIRLTDNCKKILNLEATQKYTECERKVGESVFYNLEYRKVTIERKVGFCKFLKTYGKMINIVNDDFQSDLKKTLEGPIEGTKTYVISKAYVSGDNDDTIKNTWKSIISILGDKQEYLPDIWELAMSENIYYHL